MIGTDRFLEIPLPMVLPVFQESWLLSPRIRSSKKESHSLLPDADLNLEDQDVRSFGGSDGGIQNESVLIFGAVKERMSN